ncbi:MAG: ABC transporter ATP-binding protein [Proteobacteria bacterium]|nr:ABC transporter ATP-binding protein [Pseudomonadota bacterium]
MSMQTSSPASAPEGLGEHTLVPGAAVDSIALHGVDIAYEREGQEPLLVVENCSLSVGREEFVAIVGPSGCGKSTVLRAISGLLKPARGKVLIHGSEVVGNPAGVGFMFQRDTLLPWCTVHENIAIGLHLSGKPHKDPQASIQALVKLLGLTGFEKSYPSALSGGMRQRVSLGRLLAYQPDVMLMDEPFGALDSLTKVVLGRELVRIWEAERRSIVFVTHDIEEAVYLADRVVVFSPRPGRIVAEHRIDIPRPREARAIRSDPRFTRICEKIWDDLKLPAH